MPTICISDESIRILNLIASGESDESSLDSDCLDELEHCGFIHYDAEYEYDPVQFLKVSYKSCRITERGRGFLDYVNREASRYEHLRQLSESAERLASLAEESARRAESIAASAESSAKASREQVIELRCVAQIAEEAAADSKVIADSARSSAESSKEQVFEIKDAVLVAKEAAADARDDAHRASVRFWISTAISIAALLISLAALLLK